MIDFIRLFLSDLRHTLCESRNRFFSLPIPNYDRALQSSLVISHNSQERLFKWRLPSFEVSAERAAVFRMRNGIAFLVQKGRKFLHV